MNRRRTPAAAAISTILRSGDLAQVSTMPSDGPRPRWLDRGPCRGRRPGEGADQPGYRRIGGDQTHPLPGYACSCDVGLRVSRGPGHAGPGRDASVSGGQARSVRLPIPPRSLPPMAAPGPTHHYPAALRWSQAVSAMTSSTLLIPTTTSTDVRELEQASLRGAAAEAMNKDACDVCPHPRADHDAIAARFCSATVNGAIARGCVCRS
jgi:hypothetical protein